MYIYKKLNVGTAFDIAKRYDHYQNVTFNEFEALFTFFESMADSEPIEFDPIGWVCQFGCFPNEEALKEYGASSLDELAEKTTLIKGDGFVWILAF